MTEIYTYFDASLGLPGQGEMIFHWYHSWKKHGWEPRMLHPRTYVGHPQRNKLRKVLKNHDPVERARLMRFLALSTLGKNVLFSEYDVVNYGFTPPDDRTGVFRERGVYTAAGFGIYGAQGVERYLEALLDKRWFSFSDSYFNYCLGYPGDDKSLIHFSRRACGQRAKHDVVETYPRKY
jgi:hypothetical protein